MSSATPQRLYLMQLSTTTIPLPAGQGLALSSGCYLVQTSDQKNILIDSGLPADYTPPPGTPPSENKKNVLEHLAGLGLHPDDIELLIQRKHYELARSGHPRFASARPHWDHPALRYRLIDGDTELLPGLTLLETSGHTPGHQSVLLHLPQTGPVLLAIDAVVLQSLFTPERRSWPGDDNEEQLRASTRKLLDLVERERVALVIFGHDGQQWQALKKAPAYYE